MEALPSGPPVTTQTDIPSAPPLSKQPARFHQSPPSEDLYTYEQCTIMVVMQIRPQQQEGGRRPVLLSVQNGTGNKEDLPLYRLLSSEEELGGPLPPALITLLEALRQDLPGRKLRHEQRAARKTATGGTTQAVQKPSGQTQTQTNAATKQKKREIATTTASPPPVPTTANPLPKEGLVFGGLFDDL